MKRWEEIEEKGFQYLKEKYPKAIKYGNCDSTHSDVYLPELNTFVEIKDLTNGSRCGQFTINTINNRDYCIKIINNIYSNKDIKDFVYNHYADKNVSMFLIYIDNNFNLMTIEEFLSNYTFSVQSYNKKSGTRKIPKKDIEKVLKYNTSFFNNGNTIISLNSDIYNTYFNIDNDSYYINKSGEVRKRSKTNNRTWLIEVNTK